MFKKIILLTAGFLLLTACGIKSEPIAKQLNRQESAEAMEWRYDKSLPSQSSAERLRRGGGESSARASGAAEGQPSESLSGDSDEAEVDRRSPLRRDCDGAEEGAVDFNEKYTNKQYGFSFSYPKDIVISEFAEGEQGDIILAQWIGEQASEPPQSSAERLRRGGKDNKFAFQVFISEFDEAGPITAERIKRDLPEMVVDKPIHVIITKSKLTALIFHSHGSGIGKTREIWLVNGSYLYQVISYAGEDWLVGRVLEGWEFDNR